ncbi:MAG TPA: TonB-dependent receptor [Gemmatimonadaceae bacterium]|nr:TonB-dependent receptor [Gemmatimonadaceae bacterium]
MTLRLIVAFAVTPGLLGAQADTARADSTRRLQAVTVSVTRSDATVTRLPWAVGVQTAADIRKAQPTLTADEALNSVPGVMVSNRYNYSVDPRISVRGAGSRANFGTRGVKVLLDGVPQSLPDGQSQLTNVELGTIGRVEVLRGAASSLYGNGSGGVISFETDMRAPDRLQVQVREMAGTYDFGSLHPSNAGDQLNKLQLRAVGRAGNAIGSLSTSRTTTTGFRQYSAADVRQLNGAVDYALGGSSTLQFRANVADIPFAQNPGALTKAEWDVNPDSAAAQNIARGASRAVAQHQYSVGWKTLLSGGQTIHAVAYYLTRAVDNPLATPPPTSPGATKGTYSEIRRHFGGARLDVRQPFGQSGYAPVLNVGLDAQRSRDNRRNWRSTGGKRDLPTDTLFLDQTEVVTTVGPFALISWRATDALNTSAGIRWDREKFSVADHFLADGDDDSGDRTMSAASGHVGATYGYRSWLMPYANIATSFETPTTTELNARSDGTGGFNDALGPQRILTGEAGARGRYYGLTYDVSVFRSRTNDAIIQFTEVAGRAYFRNAGRTRSTGAEIGLSVRANAFLDAQLAFTQAHYVFDDYKIVNPGSTDTLDGRRLAGVPERFVRGGVRSHYRGASLDADWTWSDKLWADDANTLRIESWGKGKLDIRAAWSGRVGGQWLSPFVAVNNAFNQRYVGAITLNGTGGRVRESAPLRNWYAGLELNWSVLR